MRDGLDPAPGEVLVPHLLRGDYMEAVPNAFRRGVNVPFRAQGRCRDPEHLLLQEPWHEFGRNAFVRHNAVSRTDSSGEAVDIALRPSLGAKEPCSINPSARLEYL